MPRLVVVGGGISGLAAAWAARNAATRAGVPLDVIVLERAAEVGGKARTIVRDGWLVEGGPSGFLGGRPELDTLLHAAGLTNEILPARAESKRRFLYRGGRMREVKLNPLAFAASGIVSPLGLARLCAEPFVARPRGASDETGWGFAARRLGAEAADRLIAPMTLGVFAGDARRLSMASAFPRMSALERDHGSLVRGMMARGRAARAERRNGAQGGDAPAPLTRARQLVSLTDGMQSLPRRLAERGGFVVRCGASVQSIARDAHGWTVTLEGDAPLDADGLIIATEPFACAQLLRPIDPSAADALDAIPCPPVTVVALGYGAHERNRIPDGFGVLISRGEGLRMLGNLWETSTYAGRGPAGGILVRAMFGGAVDPEIGGLDERDMIALAKSEIARLYGVTAPPLLESAVRIARAIPQYEVGHASRVATVERAAQRVGALDVTGFGLRGVAFGDAAADGYRTGERMGRALSGLSTTPSTTAP